MIEIRHTSQTLGVYNEIFKGEAIHQMDSFFIWVCSVLNLKPNMKLLDIATGRGQMVEYASQRQVEATGFDFSMTACEIANKEMPGKIACADGHFLPFPSQYFDAVTNLGSLEHFEQMPLAVRETARVLKPGGKACIMVPNTFGLRWNVLCALKDGDVDDDGQPLQRYGTRKQWETLLKENGLIIDRVLGYEHELAFPKTRQDLLSYLRKPKKIFLRLFVVPFIPVNITMQFVFICHPA